MGSSICPPDNGKQEASPDQANLVVIPSVPKTNRPPQAKPAPQIPNTVKNPPTQPATGTNETTTEDNGIKRMLRQVILSHFLKLLLSANRPSGKPAFSIASSTTHSQTKPKAALELNEFSKQ